MMLRKGSVEDEKSIIMVLIGGKRRTPCARRVGFSSISDDRQFLGGRDKTVSLHSNVMFMSRSPVIRFVLFEGLLLLTCPPQLSSFPKIPAARQSQQFLLLLTSQLGCSSSFNKKDQSSIKSFPGFEMRGVHLTESLRR